jgi:4-hydroxy-tetrahydrodipicolinate synthase
VTGADNRLRAALTGISGILVTPFDGGDEIKPAALGPIVDRAVEAGVHLLVANGNTSEFFSLTAGEAERMVAEAALHIDGRVPLVGGVGKNVKDACALAGASRKAGASAIMVHQPLDPFVAPRGVVAYVERIAEAADGLPVLLYLRNDAIGLDAIEALCRVRGVVGIKWAVPAADRLAAAMARADPAMAWIGGLAEPWAPKFYAVGARGFTSGLINARPERSVAIHAALEAGNYDEAERLIAGIAQFEQLRAEEQGGTNVSVVKAALELSGHSCGHARPPAAYPLDPVQTARLKETLAGW